MAFRLPPSRVPENRCRDSGKVIRDLCPNQAGKDPGSFAVRSAQPLRPGMRNRERAFNLERRGEGRSFPCSLVVALIFAFCFAATPAVAVEPDEILSDSALESRARAISSELRCLVCQNQSIDDSNAPLARDLRLLVRERLKAGDSDAAILSFLTQRYGDFVLLKPPFNAATLALWLTPLLALLAAALAIGNARSRAQADAAPAGKLSPAEEARLSAVLKNGGEEQP